MRPYLHPVLTCMGIVLAAVANGIGLTMMANGGNGFLFLVGIFIFIIVGINISYERHYRAGSFFGDPPETAPSKQVNE